MITTYCPSITTTSSNSRRFSPPVSHQRRHCLHRKITTSSDPLTTHQVGCEADMVEEKASKKGSHPQLVTLNRAFKLSEKWVNDMSGSLEDTKSSELGLASRPARLGVGATVPRESKPLNFNDPVERKLCAKLDAERRKVAKSAEESVPSALDACVNESDEELESKAQAFSKKRHLALWSSSPAKKNKKK